MEGLSILLYESEENTCSGINKFLRCRDIYYDKGKCFGTTLKNKQCGKHKPKNYKDEEIYYCSIHK